jgi:hypothetical protein
MNIQDTIKATGRVQIRVWQPDHKNVPVLVKDETFDNLVVNAGKAQLAGLANGVITSFFRYMALGTDATAAAATQTALIAEISTSGGSRTSTTNSRATTTVTNDTARFVATWTFTGSLAIREAGILDLNAGGVMLARVTTSTDVVSGTTLQITWNIKQA